MLYYPKVVAVWFLSQGINFPRASVKYYEKPGFS